MGSILSGVWQNSFIFNHKTVFTAIPCLTMMQVGQLSVTRESMSTEYWLTAHVKPSQETCVHRLRTISSDLSYLSWT